MTFLVIARDGTDPEAKARRQQVRQQHLDEVKPALEAGVLRLGGAILDDQGDMIGSALIVEAASVEEARGFLARDIYSTAGVWQQIDIYPFKIAVQAQP